ncbi:MAG: S41 family peptidase, partial [Deltaproteobacteria bacterium]|nr:S41 family peptidase [Deltaproteobacteria bacterium]
MRGWRERTMWLMSGALVGTVTMAAAETPDTVYRKLELLAEVLGQIEQHYVDAVSATDLVYGAALGATRALDAHSAFFTPDEYRELISATEGEYAGIGVELDERNGGFEITNVLDGSPAQRA